MAVGDDQDVAVRCLALGLAYNGRLPPIANVLDQPVDPFGDFLWAPARVIVSVRWFELHACGGRVNELAADASIPPDVPVTVQALLLPLISNLGTSNALVVAIC